MRENRRAKPISALLLGLSLACVMSIADVSSGAQAVTYNLGDGISLGIINTTNVNDPAPNALVCSDAGNTCNTKSSGLRGNYTGTGDINSQYLAAPTHDISISSTTATTGTWTQTWLGTVGELITHYVAVKAGPSFNVIGYDLSIITAALAVGDIITGNWTTGGILNNGGQLAAMSHVNNYNSTPPPPIPLPAAGFLLIGALGGLGGLSFLRRRRQGDAA